jgi:predicted nucleic acid-binding Zn finger protein
MYIYSIFNVLLLMILIFIVYQGVIRSCKHQIAIDVELQKGQLSKKAITYRDYVPLWKELLNVNNFKNRSKYIIKE